MSRILFKELLGEDVCQLILCSDKIQLNHPVLYLLFDKVMSDVYMLGSGVLDVVATESNDTFIIAVQRYLVEHKAIGFAAALAVLVTGASQSRQHESHNPPTADLFDVDSGRISIITVNTKDYHSDVLAIITRIMRRTLDNIM
ncbi:hypothetical protein Tco_0655612 [Tanacetum coccineum]|uniref:Uncharacterized protein n=1 Tax=Tanacetum coccineum TaxID=301880 RepID=A0ABQ4X6X9_9ASTR